MPSSSMRGASPERRQRAGRGAAEEVGVTPGESTAGTSPTPPASCAGDLYATSTTASSGWAHPSIDAFLNIEVGERNTRRATVEIRRQRGGAAAGPRSAWSGGGGCCRSSSRR
jgi:hypothetical protein